MGAPSSFPIALIINFFLFLKLQTNFSTLRSIVSVHTHIVKEA